jgi:DNA-binding response OmpR family regulator
MNITDTFSRLLRLEGHQIWATPSANNGLNLAGAHSPHVVSLSWRMPLTGSLRFLRAIRAKSNSTRTPVAIVTGDYYPQEAQVAEINQLGAELHYKPLWLDELVTLTRDLLSVPVTA